MELLTNMIETALDERRKIRIIMRKKTMKVVTLEQRNAFSTYLFISGKREEKCHYFNPAIRKKVQSIITELMHKAQQPSQSAASLDT